MALPSHSTHDGPPIAAVILAGGEGLRLGGAIKANVELDGRRLLERVAGVLREHAGPILVAHGRIDVAALDLPPDLVPVPDPPGERFGPLTGLAAAIDWLASCRPDIELLASAAVDTPFLPADFVDRLASAMAQTQADVVMARYEDQPYPTNALWRVAAFADLPSALRAGNASLSLKRLAASAHSVAATWPTSPLGDPFANINTPADLDALRRRAAETGTPSRRPAAR